MLKVGDKVILLSLFEDEEDHTGEITYTNPDGSVNVAWDDGFDDGVDNRFMPDELTRV